MSTTEPTVEHADVIALNRVTRALTDCLGPHVTADLLNQLFGAGVVFRMAQWWLDENTRTLEAHVQPRANPPIKPTNWEAATQQPPAPTEECGR